MLQRASSEQGFSLIGTIVAMVLLAIAVTALSSSAMMAVAVQTDSSVRSMATVIGASYLEEIKARPPNSLTSESPVTVDEAGKDDPNGRFIRTVEVTPEEGFPYTKRIAVKVIYPSGQGRTGSVQLETIFFEGQQQ